MLPVLLFCWALLTLHTPSTCHPLQRASPSDATAGEPETQRRQEESKTFTSSYFVEKKSNESSPEIFSYLRTISILHGKSNTFLCLDSRGEFYTSVTDLNEDCQFRLNKKRKHYDVFRSSRGEVTIILKKNEQDERDRRSVDLSSFVLIKKRRNLRNRRKRRSWTIDPSDPLGSEYPNLRAIHTQRREPQRAGKVFKETILSNDDPLQVLLSDSPPSPFRVVQNHRKLRFFD